MRQNSTVSLVIFFGVLTVIITAVVIFAWENTLMPPFFQWVDAHYPGAANAAFRRNLQQRVEHFVISAMVDVIVVTLLLRLVRRQQRHLIAGEERYRALFEHANDGIGVLRAEDLSIVEVNNQFADIAGVGAARLVGQKVEQLGWSEEGDERVDALARMVGEAPSGERELIVRTPSGHVLAALVSFNTLTIGSEPMVILIVRDISERKRLAREKEAMQAQLLRNEKVAALGQMAAQVAHEVKNPLAGLRLYALHLRSRVVEKIDAEELSLIDKIVGGVERLNDITEQILDFARPLRLSSEPTDVARVVQNMLELLEPHAVAAGVQIIRNLDAPKLVAVLDETAISSALFNLALNAVQAMRKGGTLTVSLREVSGALQISLADTGPGMSAVEVGRALEPFYTTKHKGLGLGLPYAKKIVEEHRGSINFENGTGGGMLVSITLPAGG